ncbi:MAG: PrsW family intramembrane metalloprotease [Erysipelotrichales bacterium]|nr:PrsW family intramembrane metalloprotease [Erysipelotrichales bacterium]MBQ1385430.1 PrsW family intramembrane metalloprotease [Erysipelotrichales bacterium]MBQ2310874.1 PrsW family intramembrane metalloprotease [Erysipelotrichales bacterium]MBQ2479432.1 PrsW family intramembrane metalloprotease [Erysipelotrichales bacterium]MBQ4011115.1 PrsW family intramembrane metalloprotease [Erysipelotrichales bacterium]
MIYIENIYICLAAPLFLAILCLRRDGRRSLIFVLAGMSACLLSAYVSTYLAGAAGIDQATASYEISPAVEEIMKSLPLLFFILVFEPERRFVRSGTLLVAVGFATFENVCFLTSYGTSDLLSLVIRGFGTGAMHVVCGMIVSIGLFYLWDRIWLRVVGTFALLCFVTTFHAVFNIFVSQTGVIFWIGSLIPLSAVLVYLLFFRGRTAKP